MALSLKKNVIHIAESVIERDSYIENHKRRYPNKEVGYTKRGAKWAIFTTGK